MHPRTSSFAGETRIGGHPEKSRAVWLGPPLGAKAKRACRSASRDALLPVDVPRSRLPPTYVVRSKDLGETLAREHAPSDHRLRGGTHLGRAVSCITPAAVRPPRYAPSRDAGCLDNLISATI
jgi:hypothetical protein